MIPPNQRADLTVVFGLDFHRTHGGVVRLVWCATNDPIQPWGELHVTADVQ